MRAVRITRFGGPEVLEAVELPDPEPGPDQVVVDVSRAGVNYADTHLTEDSYLTSPRLPMIPGGEVVGTAGGRRVAAIVPDGGYAERVAVDTSRLVAVPDHVDDAQALALLVQGLTAWHLLRTCTRMRRGESVVVVAAAGGVGSLAVQLARAWGAGRVVATASSAGKRSLAVDLGADVAVDPTSETLKDDLERANGDRKMDVVLEMTGGRVTDACLAALAPFGRLAFYGMASREEPSPVDLRRLMARSRTVVGFWLVHCYRDPAAMVAAPLRELFGMVGEGTLRPVTGPAYPLSAVAQAHTDLRERRTTGKVTVDVTS